MAGDIHSFLESLWVGGHWQREERPASCQRGELAPDKGTNARVEGQWSYTEVI